MREWLKRYRWWHETVLAVLLALLLIVAGLMMPNFVSPRSQLILSRHLWETAIIALPMTLIIITGGIDLSVGALMGLCAVMFGICYEMSGSLAVSCSACMLTGVVGGAVNGILVSTLWVHPLIVTLATYAAFRGIAEGVSQWVAYSQFGSRFGELARGTWAGVPIPGYLFLLLSLVFALFLGRTPGGRYLYAMGHNETAARFSGILVDRIKLRLYWMSGMLTGLATLIYISRFDTAKADAGSGMELDVITAVVIGGTSIFGGRGTILGTCLGLLLIHETRLFIARYWRIDELKSILIGVLLIVSVLAYRALAPAERQDS
jgi:rhamnose transport system permease protein